MLVIMPHDFHPFWHITRPAPGNEYQAPPLPILDPITLSRRRAQETDRRAHLRANMRLRVAATGRILSQLEQTQARLSHCSICTENGHNKQLCRGCRSTGHNRGNCPSRGGQAQVLLNS